MDEIHLVEYDPGWPEMHRAEAERLRSILPSGLVSAIEHFGSTAIPGLAAKPIIDILVAVRSVPEAREVAVSPMESLGYTFWTDNPKVDRLFFVKGLPPRAARRTHHVHMTEPGSEMWGAAALSRLPSHASEGGRALWRPEVRADGAIQGQSRGLYGREIGVR
jgi:GrpB-like predicted nucleotidyltransferase (UPF0157 family)